MLDHLLLFTLLAHDGASSRDIVEMHLPRVQLLGLLHVVVDGWRNCPPPRRHHLVHLFFRTHGSFPVVLPQQVSIGVLVRIQGSGGLVSLR